MTVTVGRKNNGVSGEIRKEIINEAAMKAVPIFVSRDFCKRKVEEYFRDVRITNHVAKMIWINDKKIEERIINSQCKKKVDQAENFLLTKVVTSLN